MVNEPSVFEPLKFYCSIYCGYKQNLDEMQNKRMTKLKLVQFVGSTLEGMASGRPSGHLVPKLRRINVDAT